MGGKGAEKYAATGALSGQKTEILTKMMPLLSQQGDKEGSVRIITKMFDKMEKTLPSNNTPPVVAKRMMTETVRNMFGFAKAIRDMGLTKENTEGLSEKQIKSLAYAVEKYSKNIELTPEEEAQQEALLNATLEPIDKLIAERGDGQSQENIQQKSYSNLW